MRGLKVRSSFPQIKFRWQYQPLALTCNATRQATKHTRQVMPKIGNIFGGDYLKAEHLGDRPVTVTIESVKVKSFDEGDKLIMSFVGKDKSLVVNRTNANIVAEVLGSTDTDDWEGKRITLVVRKVDFQGKRVPAIRVSDEPPKSNQATKPSQQAAPPEPEPDPVNDDPDNTDCPF